MVKIWSVAALSDYNFEIEISNVIQVMELCTKLLAVLLYLCDGNIKVLQACQQQVAEVCDSLSFWCTGGQLFCFLLV